MRPPHAVSAVVDEKAALAAVVAAACLKPYRPQTARRHYRPEQRRSPQTPPHPKKSSLSRLPPPCVASPAARRNHHCRRCRRLVLPSLYADGRIPPHHRLLRPRARSGDYFHADQRPKIDRLRTPEGTKAGTTGTQRSVPDRLPNRYHSRRSPGRRALHCCCLRCRVFPEPPSRSPYLRYLLHCLH